MTLLRATVMSTALLALVVACSTYGAEESTPGPADASSSSSTSSGSSTSSSSGGTVEAGGNDSSSPPVDAALDAPSFSEKCPACPTGETCIASGCSDGPKNAICGAAFEAQDTVNVIAFICPEGPTVTMPSNAPSVCSPGTPKHGAVVRLGSSATYRVEVSGQNPFILTSDCTTTGGGSCGSASTSRDMNGLLTIFVGTTSSISSCVQVRVKISPS